MQLITGAQVRMARSLLKWSREELAKKAHVSRGTIRIFEEDIPIRESIVLDIHSVFDSYGVEFLPDGGVKPRMDGVKDFRGLSSCDRFFENVERIAKESESEVVCSIQTQNMLTKVTGPQHRTNFERLEQLYKVVPVRCLLQDDKIKLPSNPSFEVRVLSEEPTTGASSCFTYGPEHTAAFEIDTRFGFQHPVYMVLKEAHKEKRLSSCFNIRWNVAKPYVFYSRQKRTPM